MNVDPKAGRVRYRVIFSGRVQGVGFRATAQEKARRVALVGYVRNQADGTVEMEVEGMPRHVDAFLKDLDAHFMGYIANARKTKLEPRGEEQYFDIR